MYNVIGLKRRQYTNKKGREVSGYNVYLTYEDKCTDGHACLAEWCSCELVQDAGLAVGDNVELLYNRYGRVESVRIV